jgi:uncharacterized protein YxeA
MKDQLTVIILVAVLIILAFRIYQKFTRKDAGKKEKDVKKSSSFTDSVKDDDYEPYSKG